MAFKYSKPYPKKSLGQNYLIDENIGKKIIDTFNIKEDDLIVEIGPGKGEITKHILSYTKNVTAIEIDKNNFSYLKENFPNLNVINQDFLKTDLKSLRDEFNSSAKEQIRIIGNIPYYISSEILFKLIDHNNIIQDVQIMMQDEVAQRIVAKPSTKAYGILSIILQVFSTPKLIFKVSKNCFYPKPKVDSRIVHFDFNENKLSKISNIDFFRKFIRTSFGTRRKTLRNTLLKMNIKSEDTSIDFDFTRRAESLSVDELIDLSNKLYSRTNN